MLRLIVHSGPWAGREIVTAQQRIVIGSNVSAVDLGFDDPNLAPSHCVLTETNSGTFTLEHAGQVVPIYINGQLLDAGGGPASVSLSSQDRFTIGSTEIELQLCSARLIIVSGKRSGREVMLGTDLVSMGRAPDNFLEFDDPQVSIYHAVVRCTAGGYVVEDQNSTNGTKVNGHPISSHLLGDGDSIHVGGTEMRFVVDHEMEDDVNEYDYDASGQAQGNKPTVLARLAFLAGTREGESFELTDDQIMVGRRPSCFIPMTDLRISGTHFGITRIDDIYHITDLQSANGTLLNNKRLTETTPLKTGDLITFGDSIAEFKVAGGVVPKASAAGGAGRLTLMGDLASVMAEGAYQVEAQPKFVVGGSVESTDMIEIGSSPQCSLFIEEAKLDPVHCRIKYDNGFKIEDNSTSGTYLNDKRVVSESLRNGQVIRVGRALIDVSIRGDRCTLEVIDKAAARAAVEVARETVFNLNQAEVDQSEIGGVVQSAYKTMFNLKLPDLDALVKERKEAFKQGAPAWRPSSDLQPNAMVRPVMVIAAAASIVLLALVAIKDSGSNFINHPLSQVHSSVEFVTQAEDLGLGGDCRACHSLGNGIKAENCARCHDGFDTALRGPHMQAQGGNGRMTPKAECQNCHFEHQGMARATLAEAPNHLGAKGACSQQGCHHDAHSDGEFAKADIHLMDAGPLKGSLPAKELHLAHAELPLDKEGNEVGCIGCHGKTNEAGEVVETNPGSSCFRCHDELKGEIDGQCVSCHEQEHTLGATLVRLPDDDPMMKPAIEKPTPARSATIAGGYLALLITPLFLVAAVRRGRRKKDAKKLLSELEEYPVETIKRLVHSINKDKCVGCHMCVSACPASVLELVNHKSTVVNFDACIQCKRCEQACAFDALRMHKADEPPPTVKMPDVDAWYQTSHKGMYLIGQVAGTPQIKNASNLGTAVVHHAMGQGLRPGTGQQLGAQYDVVVVGSGPAGMSAGLTCARMGLSYTVLEKQRGSSWTIRNYYHKGKPVMAEPNTVEMAGLLYHWDTDREQLLDHWDKQVAEANMPIIYQQDVTDIQKTGEFFTVTCTDGKGNVTATYTAAKVIIAIGTMGNPRKLGCPGEDLEKVRNSLVDPDEFQGQNVLVVGGTDSAIEVVMALKETNKVWLSCRSAKFDRVKPKNLELIEAAIESGQVTPLFSTAVSNVTEGDVTLKDRTTKQDQAPIPNDVIFAMIGGHPPVKFLEKIGVPYIERPHSWSPPRSDELLKNALAESGMG